MGVDATEAFLAADATRRVQAPATTDLARTARRRAATKLRLVSGE
jgi:hypothetical protein